MILHIDMDAFFASIEQAINPRLKGRPLVVGSRDNKLYTVVCAASYEAKAYGIDSGMPTREALKLCPNLAFVPAEQSKYIWTSEQIYELLKSYGFQVVYSSIDEFQMDIKNHPQPEALARNIQQHIFESFDITASIGIAKNYLLAKLASKLKKPRGVVVLGAQNLEQILAQTLVEKLCGIGQKTSQFFSQLGIKTCLDLYQKSPQFLQENLGKNGLNLYESLHSSESFETDFSDEKPKSIGHSYTFPRSSETPGFIKAWIRLLSEMVARRLRQQKLAGKVCHLWLECPETGHFSAQRNFQEPTDDGYQIYLRALKIAQKLGKKLPKIRALGVSVSGLILGPKYPPLFRSQKRREDLIKAVDFINNRHGEDTIYPAIITLARKLR